VQREKIIQTAALIYNWAPRQLTNPLITRRPGSHRTTAPASLAEPPSAAHGPRRRGVGEKLNKRTQKGAGKGRWEHQEAAWRGGRRPPRAVSLRAWSWPCWCPWKSHPGRQLPVPLRRGHRDPRAQRPPPRRDGRRWPLHFRLPSPLPPRRDLPLPEEPPSCEHTLICQLYPRSRPGCGKGNIWFQSSWLDDVGIRSPTYFIETSTWSSFINHLNRSVFSWCVI